MNSHSSSLAGGVISTLLDEVMGLAAEQVFERSERETFFTVELDVKYKRPVPSPGVVLCKGWLEERAGRRCTARGKVEDGVGGVHAEGRGVYVATRVRAVL